MTQEEYFNNTRKMTNFLMHVFDEDVQCAAAVVTAQAEQNTLCLINLLNLVETQCKQWIKELREMEE